MPWSMLTEHSLGKKIKYSTKLKTEKATLGFCMYKIWQILKRLTGTFCRAQTLKLGGVADLIHDQSFVEILCLDHDRLDSFPRFGL